MHLKLLFSPGVMCHRNIFQNSKIYDDQPRISQKKFPVMSFYDDAAVNSFKPSQTNEPYCMEEHVKVFNKRRYYFVRFW